MASRYTPFVSDRHFRMQRRQQRLPQFSRQHESAAVEDGRNINEPTSQAETTPDINPVAAGLARAQAVVDNYSMPPGQITVTEPVSSPPGIRQNYCRMDSLRKLPVRLQPSF